VETEKFFGGFVEGMECVAVGGILDKNNAGEVFDHFVEEIIFFVDFAQKSDFLPFVVIGLSFAAPVGGNDRGNGRENSNGGEKGRVISRMENRPFTVIVRQGNNRVAERNPAF